MKRSWFIEIISSLLVLLFVYTAGSKLFNQQVFYTQLKHLPAIGAAAAVLQWLLPVTELLIALALMIKSIRRAGLWSSLLLLAAFDLYLLFAMSGNKKLPCSCGGIIGRLSWSNHLIVNLAFIILAALALFLQQRPVTTRTAYKNNYT